MAKEIWGYARVSTKEQNLARQITELRKFVPQKENIYTDQKSGKDFDRTEYKALKAVVRSGDELYVKSLDRFGRNKNLIKDELQWFRDKGVLIHIIDFPQTMVKVKDKQQRDMLDLATNIMIEILSYMAEVERNNIRARQAEGIRVWKETKTTKTGRPYGRPRKEIPSNWNKVYDLWKSKQIKSKEAWLLLKVSRNTFYKLVKEYEASLD